MVRRPLRSTQSRSTAASDVYKRFIWSGRPDSNWRPSPWQGDALPLSHARNVRPPFYRLRAFSATLRGGGSVGPPERAGGDIHEQSRLTVVDLEIVERHPAPERGQLEGGRNSAGPGHPQAVLCLLYTSPS